VELEATPGRTAVLRAADKFTPDWTATVDGASRPVVRTDGIFLGVLLEPSASPQRVVLQFRPQRTTLYLQFAGMGLALGALVLLVIRPPRPHPSSF
jgi:hypothetical protein